MKTPFEGDIEDGFGVLHNIERLLPRLEGDSDIKQAVLTLVDRLRQIIAAL